jgi:TP901 family phage tail tape measure protein
MGRRADFKAKAALVGYDELSVPWKKALRKAERQAGHSFSRIERLGLRATRGINRGFRAIGTVGAGTGKVLRATSRGMSTFTKAAGATAAIGALAVDQYGKFELQVARLGNVIGDGVDPVAEYEQTLRDMSIALGTDPIETAEAAYQAFSGGVRTTKKELQKFLPIALKASQAGFTEPAIAVDALTSVLNTFKDSGLEAVDVADKLFITEALGKTNFGEIASNIGQIASFSREMGLSFDETLAPMAALTKTGLNTSEAFTQLSSIIAGVVKPTKASEKAFKKYKIPFGADAIKKMGGIVPLMERLQGAVAKGGKDTIPELFGRKEAIKGLIALTGSGFEDLTGTLGALENSAGTLDKKFANVEQRTGFKIKQMKTGFKLLVTELGGGIAEGLGLNKIENVPEAVGRAGKQIRGAAKGFASGFLQALAPGEKLADLDWTQIASDAGKAFGEFATVLGDAARLAIDLATNVANVASAISNLAKGNDDPAEKRRLKATGRKGAFVNEAALREDVQFAARNFGSAATIDAADSLREKNALDAGRAWFGGKSTKGGALGQRSQQRASAGAQTPGGFMAGGAGGAAPIQGLVDKLSARAQAERGFERVGGEIKVTVKVDGPGTATVTNSSKASPTVPIKASVGKRKVGNG